MRFPHRRFGGVLLLVTFCSPVHACLWDYDTLRDERRGLPGIAEVLAGRWEKHSRFFYEDRVKRMIALLEKEPKNLAAYDNLAVAYEKLDEHDKAIDVLMKKELLAPAQYTTYANLGTIYMLNGDLDHGIEYIRKALAINPDAHFGREEYQLKLAIFLRDKQANPDIRSKFGFLTYDPDRKPSDTDDEGIGDTIILYHGHPNRLKELGFKDNVFDGVTGMIRFGTGKSPDLYAALGDLLALRGDKNLAYRAYRLAMEFKHPESERIKTRMDSLRELIYKPEEISDELIAKERAEGEAWVKAYQEFEDNLVRTGGNPDVDASYEPFYREHGRAMQPLEFAVADYFPKTQDQKVLALGVIFGTAVVGAVSIYIIGQRRRSRNKSNSPG